MKTLIVLLLSVVFSSLALSQGGYTKAYQFDKVIKNGTSAYSTGQTVGIRDSLDLHPGGTNGQITPLGTWVFLQSIGLVDSIKNDARFDLVLFDSQPAATSDNAAWTPSYTDLKKIVAVIPIGNTYYDGANNSWNDEPQVNRMIMAPKNGFFWYVLVIRATKTWSVGSTIRLRPLFFR